MNGNRRHTLTMAAVIAKLESLRAPTPSRSDASYNSGIEDCIRALRGKELLPDAHNGEHLVHHIETHGFKLSPQQRAYVRMLMEDSKWQPTHRHAHAGLYRFERIVKFKMEEGRDWIECVEYSNEGGEIFVTSKYRWEERFVPLQS